MKKQSKRAAVFLSRSKSAPIDVYIWKLRREDYGREELKRMFSLLWVHLNHCRHFSITDGDAWALKQVVERTFKQPALFLSSVDLGIAHDPAGEFQDALRRSGDFALSEYLLPYGSPRLKTAQLDQINIASIHLCRYAFEHLTSLRLVDIIIDEEGHASLSSALISMQALDHLELHSFRDGALNVSPLAQPTIRFLELHIVVPSTYHVGIQLFRASSLTTLSINCLGFFGDMGFTFDPDRSPQTCFPALQHLILVNVEPSPFKLILDGVAHTFPDIERLTWQGCQPEFGIGNILTAMGTRRGDGDNVWESAARAPGLTLHWPKLQTIAVSGPGAAPDIPCLELDSLVFELQQAGIPIQKLMLPQSEIARAGGEMMGRVRNLVEVEDFRLDWPTPFERFRGKEIEGRPVNFRLCQILATHAMNIVYSRLKIALVRLGCDHLAAWLSVCLNATKTGLRWKRAWVLT